MPPVDSIPSMAVYKPRTMMDTSRQSRAWSQQRPLVSAYEDHSRRRAAEKPEKKRVVLWTVFFFVNLGSSEVYLISDHTFACLWMYLRSPNALLPSPGPSYALQRHARSVPLPCSPTRKRGLRGILFDGGVASAVVQYKLSVSVFHLSASGQ